MCSRTILKQQIMRQMVMDEEKPHKDILSSPNGINNNSFKGNWNGLSQNSDVLPSLTTTLIGSEKNFSYYKPFMNSPNQINFNKDPNSDDFSFMNNNYNEQIHKSSSPYLLHNTCSVDNNYSMQSFNIENNVDLNGYSVQYHNLSNRSAHMGPMQDLYSDKTSYSCPITSSKVTGSTHSLRVSHSNLANIGGLNEEKLTKQKDRSKKESHNRIERKRRDFINHQIVELSHLLPQQMIAEGESKKNKGNILKNSVVYIQHLKNEATYTSNYAKETDLAFMLVDSYRKQIQELQQQFKSVTSQDVCMPTNSQSVTNTYNEYLLLHEQNRSTFPSNNPLSRNSYSVSSLSPLDNGSAFKVEPSSAHSSIDNNSVSTAYRIDEEASIEFDPSNDVLPYKIAQKPVNSKFTSLSTLQHDSLFDPNYHYLGLGRHSFESMEC